MKGCGRVGWMLRSLGPEQKPLSHGGGAGSGKETFANRKERVSREGSLGIKRSTSGQCSVFKELLQQWCQDQHCSGVHLD